MRSMTGFGIGEASAGAVRVSIELRSVNHRYSDVRLRLAPDYADHGFFLEQLARKHLGRGRFDVNVRIHGDTHQACSLNVERARQVYVALSSLRDDLAPGLPVSFDALISVPGVFNSIDPDRERDLRAAMEKALLAAIHELDVMRRCEGGAQANLLREHVLQARALVETCSQRSAAMADTYRAKLRGRLARLLSESRVQQVDESRLEQEIALLAERTDAAEELARLKSHLDHFASYLDATEPVGRRLDFLLQEISREANTLGAKCQDSDLSLLVVELKAEAERMREQVQNVE